MRLKNYLFIGIMLLCGFILNNPIEVFAQEKNLYSQAKLTGAPYKCTYSYPSFFGELSHFEAKILGDDFIAINVSEAFGQIPPEETSTHYARQNNMGYFWLYSYQSANEPLKIEQAIKYDLNSINETIKAKDPSAEFTDGLAFAVPLPEAECERIENFDIIIPDIAFQDATQGVLDGNKEAIQKEENLFNSLLFSVYLPAYQEYSEVQYYITATNQGLEDPNRFSIGFDLINDQMHFRINESKAASFYNPPADCRKIPFSIDQENQYVEACEFITTTTLGINIYKKSFLNANSEYYFDLNGTLITMVFSDITNNYADLNLPVEKISEIVDSFIQIDQESLSQFEHM